MRLPYLMNGRNLCVTQIVAHQKENGMTIRRSLLTGAMAFAVAALAWGVEPAGAKKAQTVQPAQTGQPAQVPQLSTVEREANLAARPKTAGPQPGRITPAQRKAAAARAKAAGFLPGVAGDATPAGLLTAPTVRTLAAPGVVPLAGPLPGPVDANGIPIPHYFGPYAYYANSPLPRGPLAAVTVDNGGSGYSATPTVTISDVYGTGSGATATATVVNGVITAITLSATGSNYSAPIITIEDPTGVDAAATPLIGAPAVGTGIRKFRDSLPGLCGQPGAMNVNGQCIPVAVPDTATYGGSDYYEIELNQYTEKLHSDLPLTTLRGYRQTNAPIGANEEVSKFHYLGPLIVARRDRPVRIKFTNNLPTGAGGDLFIPVDRTLMGAGMGPIEGEEFTENRATIHNHGALVPWISDGTPYQWTAPAGEPTSYKRGPSVRMVPDMWFLSDGTTVAACAGQTTCTEQGATNDPGEGVLTFYYNNQQSARLLFYHDHAVGITRLNVYAGEAAGYLITDDVEQDLINGTNNSGVNPGLQRLLPDVGLPMIVQDKTFVDAATIAVQDPNWRWGTGPVIDPLTGWRDPNTGDLWEPSVYMPAQNPYDLSGASAFGRWQYGPWFWPPTNDIQFPPVPNEHFDANCDATLTWCEPPMRPATPNPSVGMEQFNDTPMINGTAYPYVDVEPRAYRFRVLNAANDRFFNLHMYIAADRNTPTTPGTTGTQLCDGSPGINVADCTEVKMVPATNTSGFPPKWSTDGREGGVPDPATAGPSWIQIGTEGGFLPAPVEIPPQPINWNMNATAFNVGNVTDHSLLLGPAERADVIVDFSKFAGKTLILYNDAPAAFPALDPRYDYYTGDPNQMDTGGAPTTLPGYGPNTRTVMQIRVGSTNAAQPYNLAALQAAFTKTAVKAGVFEAGQDSIIVPQAAYNSAYNPATPFPGDWRAYVRIFDTAMSFTPVGSAAPVSVTFEPKAIHDEMGAAYDTEYGRMGGLLGLELLGTNALNQNLVLYSYNSPPTDIMQDSMAPIGQLGDGTQIWKITHNGVDTHPIHFHLFNVQLINRVAWDGALMPPEPNELGWKETVRVNPLEDTIVAMRPVAPTQPFDVPNSIRLINPSLPEGAPLPGPPGGFVDPGLNAVTVFNHYVNFGWEYVWHCHILSHEEMDMMHGLAFAVAPASPGSLAATTTGGSQSARLTWTDNSANESGFKIERATDANFTLNLTTFDAPASSPESAIGGTLEYIDNTIQSNTSYYYRILATNVVGDTGPYPPPAVGFPTKTVNSAVSNTAQLINGPIASVAPTALVFGNQLIHTASAEQTVTLSNNGSSDLTVSAITFSGANLGDFAQTSACGTVAPGGSCIINVTFTPAGMGARTASLTVSTNDPVNPTLTVSLSGTGVAPVASVSPTTLSFGSQLLNIPSAAQTVTLSNTTGTADLTINDITFTGANGVDFAQTNNCGGTVLAGASCTISVTFTPTAEGARAASMSIANSDSAHSPLTVSLSGTGVLPIAGIAPASLTFPDQLINTTSPAQTVTLSNTGSGPLAITSIGFTGANAANFAQTNTCGSSLTAGASCPISVRFTPNTPAAFSADLTITSNDPNNQTLTIPMTGTGIALVAPSNLAAVIRSATQARLTWIDNSNNETSFAVWRSVNGAPATQIATVNRTAAQRLATGGTVLYTNGGLSAGNTYVYYVTAVNATGGSPDSNLASLSFTVPDAPSNLSGTAVAVGTRASVTLTWTDNSSNETGFTIQRSVNGGARWTNVTTTAANVTTYTQNLLLRGRTYEYRVRANNPLGSSGWVTTSVTTP